MTTLPPRAPANGVFQVVDLEAVELAWEVPGPVIEATVGDTLLVRFTNRLPEPTSIHWHGLRLAAAADRNDPSASVPSGTTVEYRLTLPDAGTFYYHERLCEQPRRSGLYGGIVVRDPSEPRLDGERVLVFADLEALLLVNGVREPQMQVQPGQVERWRLINASGSRCLRLSLDGHRFRILGTDGGLVSSPQPASDLLLAPGDRYDVAVGPFRPHRSIALDALVGGGADGRSHRRLATLVVTRTECDSRADLTGFRRSITALADHHALPDRVLTPGQRSELAASLGAAAGAARPVGSPPSRVGELQTWDLVNDTETDQPFHLHGSFFQVLAVNGRPPPYRSWEDTIPVPARGQVRIAWMPDDRPTWWTYQRHAPRPPITSLSDLERNAHVSPS